MYAKLIQDAAVDVDPDWAARSGGLAALATTAPEHLLHALDDEGGPVELEHDDADVGQRREGEHGQGVGGAGRVELVEVALEAVAG